ncbi:MAG: hypothetical protein AAGA16_18395 [Cyanobacteria bacterium P01_E01_bin.35]
MSIKYIFCINSGRSGSDYLTELLSKAENTVSIHEGVPIMNGSPMRKYNNGDEGELQKLMPLKIREINKKSKNGSKIYCETNHSFIKGWGYLLPDAYISQSEIGVIILKRDIDKTAYSLIRVRDVPGISEWTRTWLLSPNSRRNLSQPDHDASPWDLCQWYVKETYLRGEEYKKMFPRIKYVECDLEQLNNYEFIKDMFATFGLIPTSLLQNAIGKVVNVRNEWSKLSLEELLATSNYPSADSLEDKERDELISQMLNHLQTKKADAIAQAQPDYAMGGSFAMEANKIVADAERELEEVFQYSLMFTETEGILIWELLNTINPKDLLLICCERSSPPGIRYTYEFNQTLSIVTMIQKLGLSQVISMIIKGIWNKDYTHRKPVS